MKILLIGNAGSIHIRRWAASLAARGLPMFVLSRKQVPIEGAELIPAEVPRWTPWRSRSWAQRRRAMLKRVVEQVRPDIVHVHFLGAHSVFPDDLAELPLVVNTWGSDVILRSPETAQERDGKRAILRAATRVLASSRHLARATCEYAGLRDDCVTTNYWGVELDRFTPPAVATDEPVIGFVKVLESHYGPDTLLEAFARIKRTIPAAQLLIAGRGNMEHTLRNRARELGIASAVKWLGQVDYRQIPALFAGMSVSAMPSTYEARGMAALESQAMRVPVVGSTAGGIPEVVQDRATGILVPPGDPQALADALLEILSGRQLRNRLGAQGREHVERDFNWNDSINRMIETYETVVEEPKNLVQV